MSAFSRTILDFLFPPFCQGCGMGDAWLCKACLKSISFLDLQQPITSLAPYADPLVRKLITNFKYGSARCLEESFRFILERYATEIGKPEWTGMQNLTVMSVPANEQRIRERGFDHAAVLARIVRDAWVPQAKLDAPLKRVRQTLPNAKLEDDLARKGNVLGAFEAVKPVSGTVVLIDDVYTTGATIQECEKTLLGAGAKQVFELTFAKG